MTQELIECYGLIGDMRTAALISRSGRIDWCCLPRFPQAFTYIALNCAEAMERVAKGTATALLQSTK